MYADVFENSNSPEAMELKKRIYELMEDEAKTYEEIGKRVFGGVSSRALGDIYEVSRCLELPLESGVYFLRNESTGLLKIGCAKDIRKRISQIKTAFKFVGYDDELSLEAVHLCFSPHLYITESFFHKEFSENRVKGEWFNIAKEELTEYFMMCDFAGDYFGETLVSISEYESFSFSNIEKDFKIDTQQLIYEKLKDMPGAYSFDKKFLRSGVTNKVYKIIKAVEYHGVSIAALDVIKDYPDADFEHTSICKVGIIKKDAEKEYDFQSLKREKYDIKKMGEIIEAIQKNLKKGVQ